MFRKFSIVCVSVLPLFFSTLTYGESALRVACYDDNEGAKVYVNDKFRGHCPIDVFVPGGDIALRAVKNVDRDRARFFETSFYLPDDSAKSIEVILSEPQITQSGAERQRQEQLAQERDLAQKALKRARAGELDAMNDMAAYYAEGYGVAQNAAKAAYWQNQYTQLKQRQHAKLVLADAEAGKLDAMEEMVGLYRSGQGVSKDLTKAADWANKVLTLLQNKADEGDIDAMQKLSSLYRQGELVNKNADLAADWLSKANERKAELEEYEQHKALQARYDSIVYFDVSKKVNDALIKEPHMIFSWSVAFPSALVSDLSSLPTLATEAYQLKQALAARPAKWDNPDSMVAKSYALKLAKEEAEQEQAADTGAHTIVVSP